MANIKDFYRGDSKVWRFEFGNGVDVTGWKIYLTLKTNKDDDDSDAVLQVSNTAGDNVLDDISNGTIHLTASSVDTAGAKIEPDTKYFYGFQRVIPGSPVNVRTLHTGTVKILQDITISIS